MGLEDIKEIKECHTQEEVNALLSQANWRLIETKVEKIKVPVGKEQVGTDSIANWLGEKDWPRYEIKYEEKLVSLYVLGRHQ